MDSVGLARNLRPLLTLTVILGGSAILTGCTTIYLNHASRLPEFLVCSVDRVLADDVRVYVEYTCFSQWSKSKSVSERTTHAGSSNDRSRFQNPKRRKLRVNIADIFTSTAGARHNESAREPTALGDMTGESLTPKHIMSRGGRFSKSTLKDARQLVPPGEPSKPGFCVDAELRDSGGHEWILLSDKCKPLARSFRLTVPEYLGQRGREWWQYPLLVFYPVTVIFDAVTLPIQLIVINNYFKTHGE